MITPISRVMSKDLIAAPEGTSLFDASRLMAENRIRHLPIIDDNDEVVGIISQRDINLVPDSKTMVVEMMMSSPVESVRKESPLRQTILKMLEKKISSILVVDADEKVMGIVTTDDLLWHLAHLLADEKESHHVVLPFSGMKTIGEFATQMSNVGI